MWFMKKEKKTSEEISRKEPYVSLEEVLKYIDKGRCESVVFPPPPESEFQKLQYRKLLLEEYERATDPTGFFSVCVVYDLMKLGCFSMTPATEIVHEELRMLHCLKFVNIPPEIREQIPDALNFIFNEGKTKAVLVHSTIPVVKAMK